MVDEVRKATSGWGFDRITIGTPGAVVDNRTTVALINLGGGWVGFDFGAAFGVPTRLINDAVMQALGSYEGGKMLFLGLGTGLGVTMIVDDTVVPLEVAHLPYRNGRTYEDHLGKRGLDRLGRSRWERYVHKVVALFAAAFVVDDIVLGGGNTKELKKLPALCRRGANDLARRGGERVWADPLLRI